MNAGRWLGVYLGLQVDDSEIGSSSSRTIGWEYIYRWTVRSIFMNTGRWLLVYLQVDS